MKIDWDEIAAGHTRTLSRAISHIMTDPDLLNEAPAPVHPRAPVIGITGPPGAGKSTLIGRLIGTFLQQQLKVAVLCIDPSSPFTNGAVLGDRIRMAEWHNEPDVFIRSFAARGSMGGLMEGYEAVIRLLHHAPFDIILLETVGVGQNETKIREVADKTVVVLVPESGDDIQMMKAGLMEIADLFVINKSDRPGATQLVADLNSMIRESDPSGGGKVRVFKTIASNGQGIEALAAELATVV